MEYERIAYLREKKGPSIIIIYRKIQGRKIKFWYEESNRKFSSEKVDRLSKVIRKINSEIPRFHEYILLEVDESIKREITNAQKGAYTYYNSQERILDIFNTLLSGKKIQPDNEALQYGVHKETIKSDVYTINSIINKQFSGSKVIWEEGSYCYVGDSKNLMVSEAFIILSVLYHSKSLSKIELRILRDKLIAQFTDEDKQRLKRYFASYDFYYSEIIGKEIKQQTEIIFKAIMQKKVIQFSYMSPKAISKPVTKQLTLIVHDGMFYLVAEKLEKTEFRNYRLDRISDVQILPKGFRENERCRFEPGKYQSEAYNMFGGNEEKVMLKIIPEIKEYLLRKFPQATYVQTLDEMDIYQVNVRGTEGILFWILSQRNFVEVIEPVQLREEVKNTIQSMLDLYK